MSDVESGWPYADDKCTCGASNSTQPGPGFNPACHLCDQATYRQYLIHNIARMAKELEDGPPGNRPNLVISPSCDPSNSDLVRVQMRLEREAFAERADKVPPNPVTPPGQLYEIGARMRLLWDVGIYKTGDIVTIKYSYFQKYSWMHGGKCSSYSLNEYCVDGDKGNVSWVRAGEMERA